MIELVLGDCIKVMKKFASEGRTFDMVFVDPPYIEWHTGRTGDKPPSHLHISYLSYRLVKPDGVVFLCGTLNSLLKVWRIWSKYFKLLYEHIWVKPRGLPPINKKRPLPAHENIWCLYRRDAKLHQLKIDIERAAKVKRVEPRHLGMKMRYGDQIKEKGKQMKTAAAEKKYPKDVTEAEIISKGHREYVGHPTQKPLRLMRLLVKISTDKDDWVLDPFMGSGTTLVACAELGRSAVGIEIDPKYYNYAKSRLLSIKGLEKYLRERNAGVK